MDVTNSCAWYSTYAAVNLPDGMVTTLQHELGWSYQHFRNHVKPKLYEDVNKIFTKYSEIQRGGPLFLWLLLDTLAVTNDNNLRSLITKATRYNIKRDLPSEDITQVTRNITNLTENITSIRYDMEHPLPDLYLEQILQVYQTTSCEVFNHNFATLQQNIQSACRFECVNVNTATLNTNVTPTGVPKGAKNTPKGLKWILLYANNLYNELKHTGAWDVSIRTPQDSGFRAQERPPNSPPQDCHQGRAPNWVPPVCWSCGGDHTHRQCPHPKDQKKIDAGIKTFLKKQQQRHGTPYKWRPPESGEDNKCTIDNKPYSWDSTHHCWIPVNTPPHGIPP
eukprot:jgi/Psemu1/290471/fgenesh1_pg.504_\